MWCALVLSDAVVGVAVALLARCCGLGGRCAVIVPLPPEPRRLLSGSCLFPLRRVWLCGFAPSRVLFCDRRLPFSYLFLLPPSLQMEDPDPLQAWLKDALSEKFKTRHVVDFKNMCSHLGLNRTADDEERFVEWCQGLAMTASRPDRTSVEAELLQLAGKKTVSEDCGPALQKGLSVLMLALGAIWQPDQSRGMLCG